MIVSVRIGRRREGNFVELDVGGRVETERLEQKRGLKTLTRRGEYYKKMLPTAQYRLIKLS